MQTRDIIDYNNQLAEEVDQENNNPNYETDDDMPDLIGYSDDEDVNEVNYVEERPEDD